MHVRRSPCIASRLAPVSLPSAGTHATPHPHPQPHPAPGPGFALSGALSRALCLVHRLQQQQAAAGGRPRGRPRVLALLGCGDTAAQYIPVMNAIFSAQRAQVVLDAVVVAPQDSSFMQQAAHLTGAVLGR